MVMFSFVTSKDVQRNTLNMCPNLVAYNFSNDWFEQETFLFNLTQSQPIKTHTIFNTPLNGAGFQTNVASHKRQIKHLFSHFWLTRTADREKNMMQAGLKLTPPVLQWPLDHDSISQTSNYKKDDVFTSFKFLVLCFLMERIGARFAHISYSSSSLISAEEHQGAAPVLHVAVALTLLIAPEPFDRVRFSIFTSADPEWWARQRWWKGLWSRCHFHWGHHKGLGHEKTP